MFQTEIHHFLQSFANEPLTLFMRFITNLGYQQFFLIFLLFMLWLINFKKSFLMFMILLWTAAVTVFFKHFFDLPRPFHVDNTIVLLDSELPGNAQFDFTKRGATQFWETLPADVLEVTRNTEGVQNGFPSGHSSIAIAFWVAIALLYRKKWVSIIAVLLIILIPLSRMYLGVHFLADILGGLSLGAILLAIFYPIVLKKEQLQNYLSKDHYDIGLNGISALLLIAPLPLFFILSPKYYILIAFMLAFGLGFLLLAKKGLPSDEGPIQNKIFRCLIGISLSVGTAFILRTIGNQMGLGDNQWMSFATIFFSLLVLMWGATEISIRLGWFKRKAIA